MSAKNGSAATAAPATSKLPLDRLPAELVLRIVEAAASVDETEEGDRRSYVLGRRLKKLKATIKPPRIPGAAYLSPVHDDFAILARLPKLKTLIVVVKSFLGDKHTSEFGLSTVDINLLAEKLYALCIVNGILNFPATTDKAPLALKRLALCGYFCSESSLSTLLSTSRATQPKLVDQLDFLQFEDHHGEMPPVGWYTSKAPTLCMADSEAAHLDKVRYLYINPRPYGDENWSVSRDAQLGAVFRPANLDKFLVNRLHEICKAIEVPVVMAEDGHIEPRTDEERDEFKNWREATYDEFDFDEAEWMYRTDFILPAFVKYIQSKE
ncbi:hypothetical protein JCM10296v2_003225 [Rhodotorula toruloides]